MTRGVRVLILVGTVACGGRQAPASPGPASPAPAPTATTPLIRVDQAGYPPDAPKVAMVVSSQATGGFFVLDASDTRVVFKGTLGAPVGESDSGDQVRAADFSAFQNAGTFVLEVSGVGRSWPFRIDADVYRRVYYLAMRSYYGQRCGTAVDLGREFPGYSHAACHLDGAFHPSSGRSGPHASSRGWHDAGDYGRYVVNSGLSTGTLLWTWELFADRIRGITLDLPESPTAVPDLLDEVRWNLDWMLLMQDDDGGAWQKQTGEQFPAFVMPEADHATSVVIGTGSAPFKSSCATADLASVAAIASRAFRPFDAPYADRALASARKAWGWLEKNPNVVFHNPAGVATGEYGDERCDDETLWAASELWRATGDAAFERYFLSHYQPFLGTLRPIGPPAWPSVAPLGLWGYALSSDGDEAAKATVRQAALTAADAIVARTAAHGYHVSLDRSDYIWGSNGVAANYGMQLLVANVLRPDRKYVDAALDNLHYLLGRNTFSLSWVTGIGANAFKHPHHRPSGADTNADPWPGLLSGGPNQHREDPAMQNLPAGLPPAKMYLDDQNSYASNEIAINWNAPLVFLLAGVLPE